MNVYIGIKVKKDISILIVETTLNSGYCIIMPVKILAFFNFFNYEIKSKLFFFFF
jgi:hypothetical protein